ncbi:hypothetical protein SUGI_0435940 [Cryptomeria japonica]|nr:hypothetical protein SUGI_0435940 [Cryptomeria japonica]
MVGWFLLANEVQRARRQKEEGGDNMPKVETLTVIGGYRERGRVCAEWGSQGSAGSNSRGREEEWWAARGLGLSGSTTFPHRQRIPTGLGATGGHLSRESEGGKKAGGALTPLLLSLCAPRSLFNQDGSLSESGEAPAGNSN